MTDLTPHEHEQLDVVEEAARWYAETGRPVDLLAVCVLRRQFGLTALPACEAIAMARRIQTRS